MRSHQLQALLAVAALSAVVSVQAMPYAQPKRITQPRRDRSPVQRMVTSASDEIKAWNAAVDARKTAKKNRA